MSIPTSLSLYLKALHGLISEESILDGTSHYMMDTRMTIGRWRSFEEYKLRTSLSLIYAFMEKHNIEQTEKNWNAIAKRYQRKRDIYKRIERRKKNSKK